MGIETILSRLQGVRRLRDGRWVAKCPAHEDRTPSLAIGLGRDGRIVLHDFGGCGTDAVLAAVGLTLGDLFAEPLTRTAKHPVRPFTAHDALTCLAQEASVVAISASDLVLGRPVDADRLAIAAGRIAAALEGIS